jgi:hypothetical protein
MLRAAAVSLCVCCLGKIFAQEPRDELGIYRKKRAGASPFFRKIFSFRMNV